MRLQSFYNHNDQTTKHFFVAIQRNGNDKNGNPIYLVNIFSADCLDWTYNHLTGRRLDKNGNIRIMSYNIDQTIQQIVNDIKIPV